MKKLEFTLPFVLTLNDISSIYLGTPNRCMCGCSGHYAYTKFNARKSGQRRGYSIGPEEISDRKVKSRLKRFLNDPQIPDVQDNYIFTKILGNKQITIYLNEPEKKK